MSPEDRELIDAARRTLLARTVSSRHEVAAALRTRSGRVFTAVHVEATVGRIAVCAEAVALGMAATAGDTEIATGVAVRYRDRAHPAPDGVEIMAPCGMCRELLSDYSPDAHVIIETEQGATTVPVADLLPRRGPRSWD